MIIEEKKQTNTAAKPSGHKIELSERERLKVSGVENIEGFSDTSVVLDTAMGRLLIKGEGLHINNLSLEDGNFSLDGRVNSMEYLKKNAKKGSFFENLFK